jgi:hypothetical protein
VRRGPWTRPGSSSQRHITRRVRTKSNSQISLLFEFVIPLGVGGSSCLFLCCARFLPVRSSVRVRHECSPRGIRHIYFFPVISLLLSNRHEQKNAGGNARIRVHEMRRGKAARRRRESQTAKVYWSNLDVELWWKNCRHNVYPQNIIPAFRIRATQTKYTLESSRS